MNATLPIFPLEGPGPANQGAGGTTPAGGSSAFAETLTAALAASETALVLPVRQPMEAQAMTSGGDLIAGRQNAGASAPDQGLSPGMRPADINAPFGDPGKSGNIGPMSPVVPDAHASAAQPQSVHGLEITTARPIPAADAAAAPNLPGMAAREPQAGSRGGVATEPASLLGSDESAAPELHPAGIAKAALSALRERTRQDAPGSSEGALVRQAAAPSSDLPADRPQPTDRPAAFTGHARAAILGKEDAGTAEAPQAATARITAQASIEREGRIGSAHANALHAQEASTGIQPTPAAAGPANAAPAALSATLAMPAHAAAWAARQDALTPRQQTSDQLSQHREPAASVAADPAGAASPGPLFGSEVTARSDRAFDRSAASRSAPSPATANETAGTPGPAAQTAPAVAHAAIDAASAPRAEAGGFEPWLTAQAVDGSPITDDRLTTAAAGASRALPATAHAPAGAQIALQIVRSLPNGIDRFSVHLQPAELGSVDIQLNFEGSGRVSALITVERAETLELLQRDSRLLERSLGDNGLKLSNDGLNFTLKQDHQQQQQGQGFHEQARARQAAAQAERAYDHAFEPEEAPINLRVDRLRLLDIET